jgi:hypothetical protein
MRNLKIMFYFHEKMKKYHREYEKEVIQQNIEYGNWNCQ